MDMLIKILIIFINFLSKISLTFAAHLSVKLFSHPKRFNRTHEECTLYKQAKQINFASSCIANQWSNDFTQPYPIVFLVHGWESRGTTFHVLIKQLLAQNFHIIAWNAPAHGASPGKQTNLFHMAKTLADDMAEKDINPDAMIGHSMGGAVIGLLSKYRQLPKSVTLISSPTDIVSLFSTHFDKIKLNKKIQTKLINNMNNFSQIAIDQISLIDMDIYKTSDILIIHDQQDKEIPFDDFLNLQKVWKKGEFHSTDGLGHRRILRDDTLCKKITQHILNTYQ